MHTAGTAFEVTLLFRVTKVAQVSARLAASLESEQWLCRHITPTASPPVSIPFFPPSLYTHCSDYQQLIYFPYSQRPRRSVFAIREFLVQSWTCPGPGVEVVRLQEQGWAGGAETHRVLRAALKQSQGRGPRQGACSSFSVFPRRT